MKSTSKKRKNYIGWELNLFDKANIFRDYQFNFLKNKFSNQSNVIIGKYNLDLNSRKIIFKGKCLDLTERETSLIIFINEKMNVTVKDLQKNVWDYSPNLETHTVETHVYRLRKKMRDFFGDDNFILNTNNGYSIN